MPAVSKNEAIEKLAEVVETAKSTTLAETYGELFPDESTAAPQSAANLAHHIRAGLKAEEVVDLWNVLFPTDRNVWYDEVDDEIHYNEELIACPDVD